MGAPKATKQNVDAIRDIVADATGPKRSQASRSQGRRPRRSRAGKQRLALEERKLKLEEDKLKEPRPRGTKIRRFDAPMFEPDGATARTGTDGAQFGSLRHWARTIASSDRRSARQDAAACERCAAKRHPAPWRLARRGARRCGADGRWGSAPDKPGHRRPRAPRLLRI